MEAEIDTLRKENAELNTIEALLLTIGYERSTPPDSKMPEPLTHVLQALMRDFSDQEHALTSLLSACEDLMSRTGHHLESGNVIVESGYYDGLREAVTAARNQVKS